MGRRTAARLVLVTARVACAQPNRQRSVKVHCRSSTSSCTTEGAQAGRHTGGTSKAHFPPGSASSARRYSDANALTRRYVVKRRDGSLRQHVEAEITCRLGDVQAWCGAHSSRSFLALQLGRERAALPDGVCVLPAVGVRLAASVDASRSGYNTARGGRRAMHGTQRVALQARAGRDGDEAVAAAPGWFRAARAPLRGRTARCRPMLSSGAGRRCAARRRRRRAAPAAGAARREARRGISERLARQRRAAQAGAGQSGAART